MSLAAKRGKDPWHPTPVPWDPACPGGTRGRRRPGRGQANPLASARHPAAARGEDAGGAGQAAALPRYRPVAGAGGVPARGPLGGRRAARRLCGPAPGPGGPGSSQPAPGLSSPAPAWLPGPAMRAPSPGPSSPWDVKGIQNSGPAPGPGTERCAWVWSCGEDGCRQGEVTSLGKYLLCVLPSHGNRCPGLAVCAHAHEHCEIALQISLPWGNLWEAGRFSSFAERRDVGASSLRAGGTFEKCWWGTARLWPVLMVQEGSSGL